jgi:hypothetical protein
MSIKAKIQNLSKEQKFLLIAVPVVLILIYWIIGTDVRPASATKNDKNGDLSNKELLAQLYKDENVFNSALNADDRNRKKEKEKISFFASDSVGIVSTPIFDTSSFAFDKPEEVEEIETIPEPEKPITKDKPKASKAALPKAKSSTGNREKSNAKANEASVESEQKVQRRTQSGFYSTQTKHVENGGVNIENIVIPCVIHNDHTLKSGSAIRLRVTEDIVLNNSVLKKNTYITGIANFQGDRVGININPNSIKIDGSYLNQEFIAYDLDGLQGLYVPGGIDQEIKKDATNRTISQGTSINIPIIGGISTDALQKKVADPTVNISSGYKLNLKLKKTK